MWIPSRMKMDGKNGVIEFHNGISVKSSTYFGSFFLLVLMALLIFFLCPFILAKIIKIKKE